jgi:2,4-dienoyl-CoA reductase-like NADH-dependent reductase (Old Yellow Enzyme family)
MKYRRRRHPMYELIGESILFQPVTLKNMELRNRFVRSATYDQCADRKGHVTERQTKLFSELAEGGVGTLTRCS